MSIRALTRENIDWNGARQPNLPRIRRKQNPMVRQSLRQERQPTATARQLAGTPGTHHWVRLRQYPSSTVYLGSTFQLERRGEDWIVHRDHGTVAAIEQQPRQLTKWDWH